jgi:hypothetical protein
MFGDLSNANASNLRGQRLDLTRSAARIPKTLSAGGQGPINGYDEYINNNLAEELSQLSTDTPPPAPCPIDPSALSIPMLTRSQGDTSTSAHTLNDTEGRHANGQATGHTGRTKHPSRSSQFDSSATGCKRSDKNKMWQKGKKAEKEVAPDEHQKGLDTWSDT